MQTKTYIIIALGNVKGIKEELKQLTHTLLNFAESENITFCTFSSSLSLEEMSDVLRPNKRGYFIFELVDGQFDYNLGNKEVEDLLFKSELPLALRTPENMDAKIPLNNDIRINPKKPIINISEMTKKEKEDMFNTLINKGPKNLTKSDKVLMKKLTE